jgi:iron complex outermembrane receptor protein
MSSHVSPINGVVRAGIGALAFSTLVALPIHAQDTTRTGPGAGSLEEVVVTARKREESLQDVPVAVTAFSADQLREQNITEAYDLQFHTPGLMMRAGAGTRTQVDFFIRGQGATFGSAPAVVTYFAEAPLNQALGGTGQLFDLQNVQVLKGPQGTLFGRSTTGGAVLFSPARPTDQFEGSLQVSGGNLNYRELTGVLNVPLFGDKLSMRLSANSVRRDGFTKSITTGQDLDDQHRDSARLGLSFKPTEWFDNYLVFSDNRVNESGTGAVALAANPNLPFWNATPPTPQRLAAIFAGQAAPSTGGEVIAAICTGIGFGTGNPAGIPACVQQRSSILTATYNGIVASGVRLQGEDSDEVRRSSTGTVSAFAGRAQDVVNITNLKAGVVPFLGDLSFKNIFSTSKNYGVKSLRDLAGSPLPAAVVWTSADIQGFRPVYTNDVAKGKNDWLDNYTNEFQIAGTINEKHNWLAGMYYESSQSDLAYPPIFSTFGDVFSATFTPGAVGGFTSDSKSITKGYFGQFTVDLSDWLLDGLRFTGGYRWSDTYRRSTGLAPVVNASGNLVPGAQTSHTVLNDQAPSWNVSFDYRINPDVLVYIATRRGFKPGGVNVGFAPGVPGATAAYTPETLDDLEFGVKWDWTAGEVRGRTNAALYGQHYNSIQRAQFLSTPAGSVVQQTNNVASAEIWGAELENMVKLTDRLQLNLTYSYIHPKYTSWPGDSNGPAPGGLPLIDSPYPGTPENQGTIGLRYSMPLSGSGDLSALIEYYRQSSVELNDSALQDNFLIPKEAGYGNLNLRFDWSNIAGMPLDAGLFVRNATDDAHKLSVNSLYSSAGFISALYAEPRTYGIELRYRMGGSK